MSLLGNDDRFGIVSTGEVWRDILSTAMREEVLGAGKARMVFAGVETLGVNAGELHGEGGEGEVKRKVQAATGRLVGGCEGNNRSERGRVSVVVLGCAGMAGMEEWVREEVGRRGEDVRVVDGVKAGIGILQGLVRGKF